VRFFLSKRFFFFGKSFFAFFSFFFFCTELLRTWKFCTVALWAGITQNKQWWYSSLFVLLLILFPRITEESQILVKEQLKNVFKRCNFFLSFLKDSLATWMRPSNAYSLHQNSHKFSRDVFKDIPQEKFQGNWTNLEKIWKMARTGICAKQRKYLNFLLNFFFFSQLSTGSPSNPISTVAIKICRSRTEWFWGVFECPISIVGERNTWYKNGHISISFAWPWRTSFF
jgi:hypothetical protein